MQRTLQTQSKSCLGHGVNKGSLGGGGRGGLDVLTTGRLPRGGLVLLGTYKACIDIDLYDLRII